MQPAVVFPHLLHNFHHLFLSSSSCSPVSSTPLELPLRYELPFWDTGGADCGKARIQGVQCRLANLLLFIDHYFNAHKVTSADDIH